MLMFSVYWFCKGRVQVEIVIIFIYFMQYRFIYVLFKIIKVVFFKLLKDLDILRRKCVFMCFMQ